MYTDDRFEVHMQLGLLHLDLEDLNQAKTHFKTCLFHKEKDLNAMMYMFIITFVEDNPNENRYFLSRIILALESRVQGLSFKPPNLNDNLPPEERTIAFQAVTAWYEQFLLKV